MRSFFLILIMMIPFAPCYGQDLNLGDLEKITVAKNKARLKSEALSKEKKDISSELSSLKNQLIETASIVKSYELESISLEKQKLNLSTSEKTLKEKVYGDQKTLIRLLSTLQRIENNPPPLSINQVKNSAESTQAAILASALVKELEKRANTLANNISELKRVQDEVMSNQSKLAANENILKKRKKKIDQLIITKKELKVNVEYEEEKAIREVENLALKVNSLKELIEALEKSAASIIPRIKPKKVGDTPNSKVNNSVSNNSGAEFLLLKGKLNKPVNGNLTSRYEGNNKGLTFSARSKSQVNSPINGKIEFSGAFKNYNNIVIINAGEGYFVVFTGIGEIFINTGETTRIGEP
ncbi:MAG: peptidoglycan DD-metalloendopeptidase family protein [Hellea sp.]|nr:peptidoglycan DD-metalloendopeptidase family protein [Hellea sp.]